MKSIYVVDVYIICNKYVYENLHKACVKHLNYKLYYQQLHLKYLCNLAMY